MFQKKFCEIGLGTVHSKAAAAATAKAENERERNFVNICHLGLHFVYDSCCMPLYLDFPLLCMSHSLCIPTYLVSIVSPLPFPINVYLILSVYLPTYLATYLPSKYCLSFAFPYQCLYHSLYIPTYLVIIVSLLPFPINVYLILSVYLSHWTICLPIPTNIVIIAFLCVPTPKLASIAFLSMYLPITITFYLYLYLGN